MAKIRENIEAGEMENIRKIWVEEKGEWCFSVVDVVGLVTTSVDARNYWKVLKNRLKNSQKELVTECNQLKMKANDGKSYLADVANERVILEIIKIVSPANLSHFRRYFDRLEKPMGESYPHQTDNFKSLDVNEGAELPLDVYEIEDAVIITAIIPGLPAEKILISITCDTVTIKGERNSPLEGWRLRRGGEIYSTSPLKGTPQEENNSEKNIQELYWGKFYRSIILPAEIEINSASATLRHGVLEIKLKKINKVLKKIVEVKEI